MSEENIVDRKDLKIQALKERLAELEDSNADLRVEVTFYAHELERVSQKLAEATEYDEEVEKDPFSDSAD